MTTGRRRAPTGIDGERVPLAAGPYRATIATTGAALVALTRDGVEVVWGPADGQLPEACQGQLLAPWPNRLRDGAWEWEGRALRLPVDTPAKGHSASHGLVRWLTWDIEARRPDRVALSCRLAASPGYPFLLDVTVEYSLGAETGLRSRLAVRNASAWPAPVALGAHPYVRPLGGGSIDDAGLLLPASMRAIVDDDGVPVGDEPVEGSVFDLRGRGRLGDLEINHGFSGLARDGRGRWAVEVQDAAGSVRLRGGPTARWVQIFTGDSLGPAARRRSIAVEPMTAPAGALASGRDLVVLTPGATHELEWSIVAEPAP